MTLEEELVAALTNLAAAFDGYVDGLDADDERMIAFNNACELLDKIQRRKL